jgi:hypothetical protein
MNKFWNILSQIYSELYCSGIKIPVPQILFHQPSYQLNCEYSDTILADISFTDKERSFILEALDDLHSFCNGLIRLEISFELNPNDEETIRDNNVLIRSTPEHSNIKHSDTKLKCMTLGLCDCMNNNTRRIYLVSERLNNHILYKTTTVHELGHFIGLDHTPKNSIMHKSNDCNILYPTYNDAKEMGKVWNCDPKLFKYFLY